MIEQIMFQILQLFSMYKECWKKNAFWPNVLLFQKQKAQSRSGKIKFKKNPKNLCSIFKPKRYYSCSSMGMIFFSSF